MAKTASKSMHNWPHYPSSKWEKWPKNAVLNLALCRGAIWRHRENCNIAAQLQSILYTTAQKRFWKIIYFLYDFWCAQTCWFRVVFGTTDTKFDTCCQRYVATCKDFLYRCASTVPALNYCGRILFQIPRYQYEVVRINFSADLLDFRNFWPQFRENCGAT